MTDAFSDALPGPRGAGSPARLSLDQQAAAREVFEGLLADQVPNGADGLRALFSDALTRVGVDAEDVTGFETLRVSRSDHRGRGGDYGACPGDLLESLGADTGTFALLTALGGDIADCGDEDMGQRYDVACDKPEMLARQLAWLCAFEPEFFADA